MGASKLVKQLEGQLWHPAIGWQVLRRSKRYQAAFARFSQAADEVEGQGGPTDFAVEFASLGCVPEIQNERLIDAEKTGSTPMRVRVHDDGAGASFQRDHFSRFAGPMVLSKGRSLEGPL
ncbi:MAG: hypothetical protein IPJ71_18435 [Bdellovibrionales bacterium]|nr:hypothetical protein [Bdellovibrionales bacterium]